MRSVLLVLVLVATACRQGDRVKCEQAVRNYATLVYWKQADIDIAKVPENQREALRRDKLAEFTAQMEKGLETLVTQCQSANNKEQIDCMINAKTADQAKDCSGN
jgi:hypothetical protein